MSISRYVSRRRAPGRPGRILGLRCSHWAIRQNASTRRRAGHQFPAFDASGSRSGHFNWALCHL